MTILAFGVVAEIIGQNKFVVDAVSTTEELKQKLEAAFPALKSINFAVAVDQRVVATSASINANSTLALLPPFSGG